MQSTVVLLPPSVTFGPSPDFDSEKLYAYELGYRGQPDDRSTVSVTFYYHDYDDLRIIATDPTTGNIRFGNDQTGFTAGVEAWGAYRVTPNWRLMAGVNLLRKRLSLGSLATTIALDQHQGNDPEYQIFLRSNLDITDNVEFDVELRKIGNLPLPSNTQLCRARRQGRLARDRPCRADGCGPQPG